MCIRILTIETKIKTFINYDDIKLITTAKTYGGKRSSKMADDTFSDADRDTA